MSVALVLALLGGSLWAINRKSALRLRWPARGGSRAVELELVERLPLGGQHSLHLVRMGDRALLVAAHGSGCTLIEARPWSELETATLHPQAMAEASR